MKYDTKEEMREGEERWRRLAAEYKADYAASPDLTERDIAALAAISLLSDVQESLALDGQNNDRINAAKKLVVELRNEVRRENVIEDDRTTITFVIDSGPVNARIRDGGLSLRHQHKLAIWPEAANAITIT